jgi:hypothetical protein
LPHTFSYIVAILIHNHFESPKRYRSSSYRNWAVVAFTKYVYIPRVYIANMF